MDTTPSRDQVALFEPRPDVPLSAQPVLDDLFAAPRKQLTNPWRWLFTVAGVVFLAWPGHPIGLALPAIFVVSGVAGLVTAAIKVIPKADFEALRESPVREVAVADLRQWGRNAVFPVDDRWVVARLPGPDAMLLARLRRVWVFGPSSGGRIGLMVPSGTVPVPGRVVDAPPPEATPAPVAVSPTEWPPPPKDDPAVRYALTSRLKMTGYTILVLALMFVLLGVDLALDQQDSLAANAVWTVPALFFVIIIVVISLDVGRIRRARQSSRWAWTPVKLVEGSKVTSPYRMRIKVRVDAPGDGILLEVSGPPSIVLAVQDSGHLWLIGDLHAARPMVAGIPEVPLVGRARGTRPSRV